jgi:hypothetical protein
MLCTNIEALVLKCGTPGWLPPDEDTGDVAEKEIDV